MRNPRIILLLLSLLITIPAASSLAATLAANTQIINTATLSYVDGATPRSTTATVMVKYALVQSTPTITPGPNGVTPYGDKTTTLHNTFIVTNTSNGPDSFSFSSAITGSSNSTNPTAPSITGVSPAGPVVLGATITVSGSTTSTLQVPSDGVNDSKVNGITNGSFIAINGTTGYQVTAITDPIAGNASITFTPALGAVPAAGVQVSNYITVTVDVAAGDIKTVGQDITVTKNLTATWPLTGGGTGTFTSSDMTDKFTSGVASLTKFVRNLTNAQVGANPLSHNATTYYQSGITAKANDVLEYILVATNSGTGTVTGAAINDVLPTAYVTFKPGVYSGGKDIAYENSSGSFTYLGQGSGDGDAALYTSGTSTLTVNVGTGAGNANNPNTGGSIASGSSVFVYYQVTVNP